MRVFLLLPFLLLSSCGNLQNLAAKARAKRQQKAMEKLTETSSKEASTRLGDKALGEIAYVDAPEEFVLIRPLTGINLPANAGLETRRDGQRSALLRSTPERKNTFATADILEGNPQTGDGVFPSTAKPKPQPKPKPGAKLESGVTPPPGPSVAPDSDFTTPSGLPAEKLPAAAAEQELDPAQLPAMPDPIKTPEDLQKP
jgi:hypothetical protein